VGGAVVDDRLVAERQELPHREGANQPTATRHQHPHQVSLLGRPVRATCRLYTTALLGALEWRAVARQGGGSCTAVTAARRASRPLQVIGSVSVAGWPRQTPAGSAVCDSGAAGDLHTWWREFGCAC